MKIGCEFAVLDVKKGREALRREVEDHGIAFPCTVSGTITAVHSRDDGVSREFTLKVDSIELGAPIPDGALRPVLEKRAAAAAETASAKQRPKMPPAGKPGKGTDSQGHPWARVGGVKAGDFLIADAGFISSKTATKQRAGSKPGEKPRDKSETLPCLTKGQFYMVCADEDGDLFVACLDGRHYLEGQIGYTRDTKDCYVGFYKAVIE